MEPVITEEPKDGFLEQVQGLVRRNGAVFIFDEVKTGFRVALGGAQELYGVVPDLACCGKAMANGMPISALVGKAEIMKEFEDVFFSMTFGGEVLSLAAALSTIKELRDKNVFAHLWKQGEKLKNGYNSLAAEFGLTDCTVCAGLPPKALVQFFDAGGFAALTLKSLFQQEVIKRGVLFNGEHMLSYSHSDEDIETTLQAYGESLAILSGALKAGTVEQMLEGKKLQDVFRVR